MEVPVQAPLINRRQSALGSQSVTPNIWMSISPLCNTSKQKDNRMLLPHSALTLAGQSPSLIPRSPSWSLFSGQPCSLSEADILLQIMHGSSRRKASSCPSPRMFASRVSLHDPIRQSCKCQMIPGSISFSFARSEETPRKFVFVAVAPAAVAEKLFLARKNR